MIPCLSDGLVGDMTLAAINRFQVCAPEMTALRARGCRKMTRALRWPFRRHVEPPFGFQKFTIVEHPISAGVHSHFCPAMSADAGVLQKLSEKHNCDA